MITIVLDDGKRIECESVLEAKGAVALLANNDKGANAIMYRKRLLQNYVETRLEQYHSACDLTLKSAVYAVLKERMLRTKDVGYCKNTLDTLVKFCENDAEIYATVDEILPPIKADERSK